jgi:hypothetical protein
MTKPEFPNLDSSSPDPQDFDIEPSVGAESPLFDFDSESDSSSPKTSPPSYPELFPMSGMTVGPRDASSPPLETKGSPVEKDFMDNEFSDGSDTIEDLHSNLSFEDNEIQAKIESNQTFINSNATDSQSNSATPPKQINSSEAPISSDIQSRSNPEILETISTTEPSIPGIFSGMTPVSDKMSDPNERGNLSPAPSVSPKTKKNKSKPFQNNRLVETSQRWGKQVSASPTAQRIAAFTGWPWVIALGISGATAMTAFTSLSGLPPIPNCKIPSSSWEDSGKLYCADQAARSKKPEALVSALEMVGDWDKNDPLYDQVNKLSNDWSRSVMDVAQRELDEGKLNQAIELIEKVPKSSSYYDESRATIKDWQTNWKDGEKILEKARDAIQEQNWAIASEEMRQLVQLGGEHWQKRADKLISEMTIEQDAFRQLNVADDRAGADTVPDIQSAILLATQIDSTRLARKKLMTYVDRWSDQLIDLADYHFEVGDYKTAMEAAQAVPPGSKAEPQAIAYLQTSRAQTASQDASPFGYIQALAYTAQVPKDAPVLEISKDDITQWEANVQSWSQLEFAKLFSRVDQEAGYKIAIDHATLVKPDNPNRVQAQSLIAQWDKQLNSVEDRKTIARAAQLAKNPDVASVQAAIAEARRIKVESPLRIRAQTLIAEWEGSIQSRIDQPILDQAIAQANQGNITAAIQTAEQITSDRALYGDAQDKINEWVAQIEIAEDEPILKEAETLANQGQLDAAIAKASEIGNGRALYYEAQDLIGGWIANRNQIEAANRPPQQEPEPDYESEPEPSYEPEDNYDEAPPEDPEPAQADDPYIPPEEDLIDSASGAGESGSPDDEL